MSCKPYVILAILVISLVTVPSFAQSEKTYQVMGPTNGQSYNVNYSLTGATVSDMSIDTQGTPLIISLQTTGDGTLTITLQRTLIDAKAGSSDDQFFILEDGAEIDFQETKTTTDRTLTISFSDGTESLEIIGTQVMPEFPAGMALVFAMAVISIVMISARTRLRFLN